MKRNQFWMAAGLLLAGSCAMAHVTLAPGGATAGSRYEAAFRVGHACKDTQATSGISVQLPEGFILDEVQPRPGWTVSVDGAQVSWQAATAQGALPARERAEFILRGKVPRAPGVLWFPVLQTCEGGNANWAQVPTEAIPRPEFPAARLDVLPPGVAAVNVRGAWAAPAQANQASSGVFMTLSAPSALRLVGASTPLAATARLEQAAAGGGPAREVQALELAPRELVELKPGGTQIVLGRVKQVLASGASLPLTLAFEDASGAPVTVSIDVPVGDAQASGAATPTTH